MLDKMNERESDIQDPRRLDRRRFIRTGAALLPAGIALRSAANCLAVASPASARGGTDRPYVGIQIAPHSFYDEGFEYCLDLLKETGRINALMISSLSYYGAMGRPKHLMADHGVPLSDNSKRKLARVWVRHHDKYYRDTTLRHMRADLSWHYSGKEIFADLVGAARQRGIRIYERMYEPSSKAAGSIRNFETVLETDIYGKPGPRPCMNNPDYRAWLAGTMRDLFESYDLDGIQYGAERSGPLSDWLAWDNVPRCFCSFCTSKARQEGINVEQAKTGLTVIHKYVSALKRGSQPTDGVLTEFLRILLRHPSVLAWEYQWARSVNDLHELIYKTIKAIRPTVQVGRHVDHQQSSYALLFRAAADYAEMTDSNDFIKLILYHDIAGPRVMGKIARLRKHVLRELTAEQSLALYYAIFGYDPQVEASAADLAQEGLSPEYVYHETKRAVDRVAGKAAIYAGIGLDIPKGGGWGTDKWQSDPDDVYMATRRAFEAGGKGVVASREYEEITLDSLRAMGKAVDEVA
jgi:hypothetical protein